MEKQWAVSFVLLHLLPITWELKTFIMKTQKNEKKDELVFGRQYRYGTLRDYLTLTLGILLYCIGWTVFQLPNDITSGGVPGIASIAYFATGISVQWFYFPINITLLLVALKILGFRFCLKTIYSVFTLTFFLEIFETFTKDLTLLQDQPFMASILGGSFCGAGIGCAFSANGSLGGTDIVAAIVNKYREITFGTVMLVCDLIIISCSYFVLLDWEKVLYGYVTLFVSSFAVDRVVYTARQSVQFFIISNKYEEIGRHINEDLHRGVTFIDGTGCYTGSHVKMMFVLAKRRESDIIFRLIKQIDPDAFVSQSSVIGVYGKGFDHIKVH